MRTIKVYHSRNTVLKFSIFLAFLLQDVFGQAGVDSWNGNTITTINSYTDALSFNGETVGAVTSQFDTIAINVSIPYDTACIEWWARYTRTAADGMGTFPTPIQTIMFYGSDVNNYAWVSVSDGVTLGNQRLPAVSLFRLKAGGNLSPVFNFTSWDHSGSYWTQFAICLQPASAGPSYVAGIGVAGTGAAGTSFYTNNTFSKITGQTSIVIGALPAALETELGNPTQFGGRIGEIRIWNKFLNIHTDLVTSRYTDFPDNYPGLVHRYKFNQATPILDSVGTSNGIATTATGPALIPSFQNQFFTDMLPFSNISRIIPFNGVVDIVLGINQVTGTNLLISTPASGKLCVANTSCTLLTSSSVAGSQTPVNSYSFRYMPDRSSCGTNITFNSYATVDSQATPTTNYVNYVVSVMPLSGTTLSQSAPVPAIGGLLQISGNNLGLVGNLALTESVSIKIGSNMFTCTNGAVTTASSLTCTVPAGVGSKGTLTITLCGNTQVIPNFFSYEAPVVSTLPPLATNFQVISFLGSNFGPFRTFDGVNNAVLISNGTQSSACNVTFNNDTLITCYNPFPLVNGANYTLTLTIGGVTVVSYFVFQKCNPPCLHNGICNQDGTCNCLQTGFTGPTCNNTLFCAPACLNGVCAQKTDGTNGTVCQCYSAAYMLPNCAAVVAAPNVGAIVGGVVGGVAFIVIVAVIIVAVLIARQEKREGANFIPLEKKDFTKIIYGDQLGHAPETNYSDLQPLEKLLIEDDALSVAFAISAITQITEADKIAKALVVIFQDNNKIIKLLEAFITQEVNTTESAGTLFRANSMVSKMFKFYSRLIGLPYLYVTIGPELGKLIEEELGLEVDPEKMEEGKDLDEMRWALMSQSQKILKQVLISHDKCPAQFRSLFGHIAKLVGDRFPDHVNVTIGGFIFLRLFCPAVSSPEAYGIVEEPPSPDSRRLLILITKVLQNLSNDVEFGSKEPYMTKMNDFIHSNRPKLVTFYESLLKPSTKPPVPCDLPKNIKPINLCVLAQHIRDNLEKVDDPQIKAKLKAALPKE